MKIAKGSSTVKLFLILMFSIWATCMYLAFSRLSTLHGADEGHVEGLYHPEPKDDKDGGRKDGKAGEHDKDAGEKDDKDAGVKDDKDAGEKEKLAVTTDPEVFLTPQVIKNSGSCPAWDQDHMRNLSTYPIFIIKRTKTEWPTCDIPCRQLPSVDQNPNLVDLFIEFIVIGGVVPKTLPCPEHQLTAIYSMEAAGRHNKINSDKYNLRGSPDLDSDVPLPYFSWAEYDLMRPLVPKTAEALATAFISNCANTGWKRKEYMQDLMKAGLTVHSYGRCMPNMPKIQKTSSWREDKIKVLQQYKFCLAFENTKEKDYVTEKIFDCFVAGSVPVYGGAPNPQRWSPYGKSMIVVDDFESPEALAKYLQYLDSNDTAYNEYLEWKNHEPSDEFKALAGLSDVHSECRTCILIGDMYRRRNAIMEEPNPHHAVNEKAEQASEPDDFEVNVRQRGKYWLHKLFLKEKTMDQLTTQVWKRLNVSTETHKLHEIYLLPNTSNLRGERVIIHTDDNIKDLHPGSELEVIFVPQKLPQRKQ